MHLAIPAAPSNPNPPPPLPGLTPGHLGISPGVGTKKEGKCPVPVNTSTIFIDHTVE